MLTPSRTKILPPTSSLFGAGLGGPFDFEMLEIVVRVAVQPLRHTKVQNVFDVWDGDRGLGDICRQDDFSDGRGKEETRFEAHLTPRLSFF